MSLIHAENFDGVAAGSWPAGWANYTATTTATLAGGFSPVSSPNVAVLSGVASAGTYFQTWQTADTNSGDVAVSCSFAAVNFSSSAQSFWLFGRGSSTDVMSGSPSYYALDLNFVAGTAAIVKVVGGTQTTLAGSVSVTWSTGTWYQATLTLSGSTLSATVQAGSLWLNSAGSWQSSPATAVTVSDSSITGSGTSGFGMASRFATAYADSWSLSTAGSGSGSSAAIAAAEGRDAASAAASITAASIAVAEARDSRSVPAAFASVAAIARAEARDAGSAAGSEPRATIAAAEARDGASAWASNPGAILTVQDGADAPAVAASIASVASASPADARDVASIAAFFPSASIAVADRPDAATIAMASIAGAVVGPAERGDAATVAAATHNTNTIRAVEAGDSAAVAGSGLTAARLSPREAGDSASVAGSPALSCALAAIEAGDRGAIVAFAAGIPPYFRVREAGDVAAILGGNPYLVYDVYDSPAADQPLDYSAAVARLGATTWTGAPLSVPGTWTFAVRAANQYGEEQNLDCAVTVIFDASGRDITNRPSAPVGLRVAPIAGARLSVTWAAGPIASKAQAPTAFRVYLGAGASAPDYANAAATVQANAAVQGAYRAVLQGVDGTTYRVGVRASNASGEEPNTTTAAATADGSGPTAVVGLAATLVP